MKRVPFLRIEKVTPVSLVLIIIGIVLCFLSYAWRLAVHIRVDGQPKQGAADLPFRVLVILTFLGYFGWGYWSAVDPVKMNIPSSISIPLGIFLAAVGLGLFLYSEIKKHGVGEKEELVTTGIYAKIRHPMYIGLVLLHIGYPLIYKSFSVCLSTLLWTGFILA